MLSGQNDVVSWVHDTDRDDAVSYPHPQPQPHLHAVPHFPLDCHDWYLTAGNLINNPFPLLPPPPHHHHNHQTPSFLPPFINPFDPSTSFNYPPDRNFLGPGIGPGPDPGPTMDFGGVMEFSEFESFDPAQAPKMLMPLEIGSVGPGPGARPTLFEKRVLGKRKRVDVNGEESEGEEEDEEGSFGGKMVNYYDSENEENNNGVGGELNYSNYDGNWSNSNANSGVTGGELNNNSINNSKRKKKGGMPAKNLMAERRRRKKLNDRLYMLRSVVPKISKVRFFSR